MIKILIVFVMLVINCSNAPDIDETEIMNTIYIDGEKNISVVAGLECYYHPIEE